MVTKQKIAWLALGALVGAFLVAPILSALAPDRFGGLVEYQQVVFRNGIRVGSDQTVFVNKDRDVTAVKLTATGESDLSRIRQGGTVLTGVLPTSTLTAAQVCDNSVARLDAGWAAGSNTATMTLPSATDMYADCLTANGDSIVLLFENAAAASASTTLILAGASTTFVGPGTGDDLINGLNWAWLTFTRRSASIMVVTTEELTDAD